MHRTLAILVLLSLTGGRSTAQRTLLSFGIGAAPPVPLSENNFYLNPDVASRADYVLVQNMRWSPLVSVQLQHEPDKKNCFGADIQITRWQTVFSDSYFPGSETVTTHRADFGLPVFAVNAFFNRRLFTLGRATVSAGPRVGIAGSFWGRVKTETVNPGGMTTTSGRTPGRFGGILGGQLTVEKSLRSGWRLYASAAVQHHRLARTGEDIELTRFTSFPATFGVRRVL